MGYNNSSGKNYVQRGKALSPRELEIIQGFADGLGYRGTAAKLGISPLTVKAHHERIARKMGVGKTAEIVLYCLRKGLIT